MEYTAVDGKNYKTGFYNLDAILSVGYRVNSRNATDFRRWATSRLKEVLLRGYSVNNEMRRLSYQVQEQGKLLQKHDEQIKIFIQTSLPPQQGVFFEGQIFDAYRFVNDIIRSAKKKNNIDR